MLKSKFIVIEGIDGSGKTNACNIIHYILKKYHIQHINVREPGSTPISENIRKIIKKYYPYEIINQKTILLLMYASRIQLTENLIKPSLNNNIWVISDRYELSSFAYQGGGFKINKKIINILKKISIGDFRPHLTLYLDVYPYIALKRLLMRGKLDYIEYNNLNFFIRTRNMYLKLISKNPNYIVINANLNLNIVHQDIKKKIKKWLKTCI